MIRERRFQLEGRIFALLGALACVGVLASGCTRELPMEIDATHSADPCVWIDGTFHCPWE